MPLNIDWQQILLHLFNFIILFAGLAFFLFKPVKKFMAEREEKYKKAAEEHSRAVAETEALEKERQVKISALDGELAERRQRAVAAEEACLARMREEARQQADAIVGEGKKRAELEREKYIAQAGDEICDIVARSAERLLAEQSSARTDDALYDKYLALAKQSVAPLSPEEQQAMAERVKNGGEGALTRGEVAGALAKAAENAVKAQGAAGDGAIYDQFLSEVNKGEKHE